MTDFRVTEKRDPVKQEQSLSRASVLRAMIGEMLDRKDGQVPSNVHGAETFFDGLDDIANALLLRWHTRLTASLERSLANDPFDREEAVIEAWRHANWIYWGVRMVIDQFAEKPPSDIVAHAVRTTAHNDWAAMAVAAGLASNRGESAARVGQRLELEARHRDRVERSTAREHGNRRRLRRSPRR